MKTVRLFIAMACITLFLSVAWAQTPAKPVEVPKFPESAQLVLANKALEVDNLQLQAQVKLLELQALVKSLEKPGFHIVRDAKTGVFSYVADPPPDKK